MKKQVISSFYHIGIDIDFENIYSYCKFTESAMKQEQSRIKEIYEENINKLTDEDKEFMQQSIDIHWKLHDVFPALHWSSIFNSAYALFENHMNELCIIFGKNLKKNEHLKDSKDKGIKRAKNYLSKVIGIKHIFNSADWLEIQNYSELRNVLVHTLGKLDFNCQKHRKVFNYARTHSNIAVFPDESDPNWAEITLKPGIIYEALLSYRIFLGKICKIELPITAANNSLEPTA